LQDPSEANEGNLSDIRREASRHFGYKKREYLKDGTNELESNNKNKNIRNLHRGINEFKKGFKPRTYKVKDEGGDMLADSHNILNGWKCGSFPTTQNSVRHPALALINAQRSSNGGH
jgi:hypothetical protein